MATSSVTKHKPLYLKPDNAGADTEKPMSFGVAFYVNPVCEHEWSKLANKLQTLASEGKIIWRCGSCSEISTTYDWQTPEGDKR